MRVQSLIARVALVLALLAGWQAALEHPVKHVDELGEFVHDHDGGSEDGLLCDVLAALTACAASPDAALPRFQSDYESPSYPSSAPRVAEAPPFLSQGPPASV
jgi:hypothetical protein